MDKGGETRVGSAMSRGEIMCLGWNWDFLENVLPDHVLRRLEAILIYQDYELSDSVAWSLELNSLFSVSSAYSYIAKRNEVNADLLWSCI